MTVTQQEQREPTIFNALLTLFFVSIFLYLALLYRQDSLALLALLTLVVMGGAKAWARMSTNRLRWDSAIDNERVFPGDSVTLATTVANGKWLPVWLRIAWTFDRALEPVGADDRVAIREAAVLWHQTVQFQQSIVALRRGVYQIGPPSIRTGDFLGFFEKEISSRDVTHLLVYPRLISLKPVAVSRRDLFGAPGSQSPVNDPVYILGTRDYQPSRPSRHIHWKASARHLRLQEKIFEPSEQAKVLLTLDVSSFEGNDKAEGFEQTLEVLASLAVQLDRRGYALGFAGNGTLKGSDSTAVPLARGPHQIPAILEALARIQAKSNGPIARVVEQLPGTQRGISCVHFCFEDDRPARVVEKLLRKRRIPLAMVVWRRHPDSQISKGTVPFTIDDIRWDRSRSS